MTSLKPDILTTALPKTLEASTNTAQTMMSAATVEQPITVSATQEEPTPTVAKISAELTNTYINFKSKKDSSSNNSRTKISISILYKPNSTN